MIRTLLAASMIFVCTGPLRAADSGERPDTAARQFAQFDKLVARYRAAYADTERLIKAGPKVVVSTSAAKMPEAQEKLRVAEEMVRRDKQSLAESPALSSGPAVTPRPEIDASACARDFSYDKMLAGYGSSWTLPQVNNQQTFLWGVVLYQVCADVASHATKTCATPSGLWDVHSTPTGPGKPDRSDTFSFSDHCRTATANARLIQAAGKGPEAFRSRCQEALVDVFAPGKTADGCSQVAASLADPKAAAAQIFPLIRKDQGLTEEKLGDDLAMLAGKASPAYCAGKKNDGFGVNSELCMAAAAYRKARAGAGGCGSSALCKAFMGGGASSCQPYLSQVRNLYCQRGAAPGSKKEEHPVDASAKVASSRQALMAKLKGDEETLARQKTYVETLTAASGASARQAEFNNAVSARRKELRGMLDELFQLINSVEPKSHPGIPERRDQIDDLQQDFDALSVVSPAGSTPRKTTKKKGGARKPR